MRLEPVLMTPTEAANVLLRSENQPQRQVSKLRVSQLADAIVRGQWKLTHQPIALDPGGVLIDGQHRLRAIVLANQEVWVLVAFDADPETFDVLDLRGTRKTSDSVHIAGYNNPINTAAIARCLLVYDIVKGTTLLPFAQTVSRITTSDILELLETDRGNRIMRRLASGRAIASAVARGGATTAAATALVAIEEAGGPDDLIDAFVEALQSGAMLATTSPLFALRRWLIGETGYAAVDSKSRTIVTLAIFIKAWNAWQLGRELKVTYFRIGNESFPVVRTLAEVGGTVDPWRRL